MLKEDPFYSEAIATLLGSAVDDVVIDHIGRVTQEHQMTAKVADRMEQAAKNWNIGRYQISARAQDFPDKGPGSLEKKTGTDLFIGLRLRDLFTGYVTEKGLLVQSKIASKITPTGQRDLVEQCKTMTDYSEQGSFVWIYDEFGTSVVPAGEVTQNPKINVRGLNSKKPAQFFKDTLDCFVGDRGLMSKTRPFGDIFESNDAFNGFLRELKIRNGLVVKIDAE